MIEALRQPGGRPVELHVVVPPAHVVPPVHVVPAVHSDPVSGVELLLADLLPERSCDRDGGDDAGLPVADLDGERLLDEIQASQRALAATQARQAVLITELAHRRAAHAVTELTGRHARGAEALSIGARAVTEEIALELRLSRAEAERLTDTCLGLSLDAPRTHDALRRGDLTWAKAETILSLIQTLSAAQEDTNTDLPTRDQTDPAQLSHDLETELLKKAPHQTRAELRRTGERAQIKANPHAAEYRHRTKRTRRHFAYIPDTDSMCRLSAYLPADQGLRAKNALSNPVS